MRSEEEVNHAVDTYADTVRRICFCHMKNQADADDIFQNVFLKYMLYDGTFETEEHEKAWMIRVSVNACKDHLRSLFRHHSVSIDEVKEMANPETEDYSEVLQAVLSLPVKYRDVIYLHYYEGYSAIQISSILKVKENTIYSLLSRGRGMLKEKLGGEMDESENS